MLVSVAVPAPVLPAVGFSAHAAAAESGFNGLSYSSASAPGDVVVQLLQAMDPPSAIPNMITAALAVAVVMAVAVAVPELTWAGNVPGVTSKTPGPPPAAKPPDVATPENAAIEPTPAIRVWVEVN